MIEQHMAAAPRADDGPSQLVSPLLSDLLRARTAAVHRAAEQSGIIADILRGEASLFGYALFLANLLPIYQALEEQGGDIGILQRRELHRAFAIETDLVAIEGAQWRDLLPVVSSASRYAERIRRGRDGDGAPVLAHSYVRYMGDLSGGLIIARLLARNLGLEPRQLTFYQFPAIADVAAYKADFRRRLDALELAPERKSCIADEAVTAFEFNIELSIEVQAAARSRA